MDNADLKKYSVVVHSGSGCIFQPLNNDYTYILTAKHIFYNESRNEQGRKEYLLIQDEVINIQRNILNGDEWRIESHDIIFREGETYFPHKLADIAILKISPAIPGFQDIVADRTIRNTDGYKLCGYKMGETAHRDLTFHDINSFLAPGNYSHGARIFSTLRQQDIMGMSGGGILKINNDQILIIGIQSKMGSGNYPAGEISFVPINHFNDIIDYDENRDLLSRLHPPYMSKFLFLVDECFRLDVDHIDEPMIEATRIALRNKAHEIANSDITPIGIKDLFRERLLVNENNTCDLSAKRIWISWLEFLVIMNVAKNEEICTDDLNLLFDSYRLKYSNIEDWTTIFRSELINSDYKGLKDGATVVVNTRNDPKANRNLYIPKGGMIRHIGKIYDKRGFKVDIGIDPCTSFSFVHLDFFKSQCIIQKLEQYQDMTEPELLQKLREEYHELFQ